jgi:hypothetical protein
MKCRQCGNTIPYHKMDCSYDHARFYCTHCEEKPSTYTYAPYCSDYCKKAHEK